MIGWDGVCKIDTKTCEGSLYQKVITLHHIICMNMIQ